MIATSAEARDRIFNTPKLMQMFVSRLQMGDTGGQDHIMLLVIIGSLNHTTMPSDEWVKMLWPYVARFAVLMFPESYR